MASVTVGSDDEQQQYGNEDFDVDNMDFDLPTGPLLAPAAPSSSSARASTSGAGGAAAASSSSSSARPFSQAALNNLSHSQEALLHSFAAGPSGSQAKVIPTSDVGKFKHYQVIYPIYIDARRPHKNGERRVSRAKAVKFPKAQEIAEVCGRYFGLSPVYEPEKTHPRDWANPGRVRVLIKDQDGKLTNSSIPDKYTLLNNICDVIRAMRSKSSKPAAAGAASPSGILSRYPFHSPAISFGTLAEAMKGGGKMQEMMNSMLGGAAGGVGGGAGGGGAAGSLESEEEVRRREQERETAEKQRIAKMKALQKQGRRMVVRR